MTGEMYRIDQDGRDDDGNVWSTHAAIARAVHGELKPFDQYQGPYVVVGSDIRVGNDPYAVAPNHLGVVRLWLSSDDGSLARVYREDTEKLSDSFLWNDEQAAVAAALQLMAS